MRNSFGLALSVLRARRWQEPPGTPINGLIVSGHVRVAMIFTNVQVDKPLSNRRELPRAL